MAHTLSGPNLEEEYLWSVTLDGKNKEYEWNPVDPSDDDTDQDKEDDTDDEEFDPSCKPNHRLLVKTAILHPTAKEGEVVMLQVETIGYKEEKIVAPFLAMKGGSNLQQHVDLLIPDSAKIKLVSGEGPITLVGSHCMDFYDYRNYGNDEDTEDEDEGAASSEDDEVDMEEQEIKVGKTGDKKSEKEDEKMEEEPAQEPKKKTPKKATPKKDTEKSSPKAEEAVDDAKKEGKKTPKKGTPKKDADTTGSAEKAGKKRKASGEEADGKKKRKSAGGD